MTDRPLESRLLELYDRVADAPDAVELLRKFVLDLAVRGKLVGQDEGDEPAEDLLKRIKSAKKQQGQKWTAAPLNHEDKPFKLPPSWRWARVGEICSKTGSGSTPRGGKSAYRSSGVPFLRSQNVHNDRLRLDDVAYIDPQTHEKMSGTRVLPGDLLLNITGGSIGRCARVPKDFGEANVSQHVAIIRPASRGLDRFLHTLIRSPYFQSFIFDEQTGAGRGGLPKYKMDQIPVALPPLAEQERIISKIDELMALLDRLETTRTQRETTRNRLTTASLTRLTAPETTEADFPTHARFALDNLDQLTRRPEQIKVLRQTIIDLAVRGKLTDEDAADEPAALLLGRIVAERTKSVTAKKHGKVSSTRSLKAVELPFDVPSHWCPVRLSQILHGIQTGPFGSSLHKSDYTLGGIPVINPASIQNGQIVPIDKMAVGDTTLERLASFKLQSGDIVMARRGEMGRCARVTKKEEGWLCGTGSLILRPSKLMYPEFLVLLIGSPFSRKYLGGTAVGSTMQNLNQTILLNLPFGLPPPGEQRRIVATVDALMAYGDRVEIALTTADTTRARLFKGLLHEALPSAAQNKEAA